MTNDDRVKRGNLAYEVMRHDGFNELVASVADDLAKQMLACSSEEATTPIFRTYAGMREFINRLAGYVHERDRIVELRETKDEQSDLDD